MTSGIPQADIERRFGGLSRLYGNAGATNIRSAHVVVVGIGGVGSWAAEALARSGVARLTLIDLDHIAESNINRQIHALDDTFGQAKVQAMRERIGHINHACEVLCVEEFVDETNWPAIANIEISKFSSLSVIDACDQVKAKTAMAAWSLQQTVQTKSHRVNFISVGAAGGKRHAHKAEIEDLSLTTHDPLLAQLRYRLRKNHGASRTGKMAVSCVFSREAVLSPVATLPTADATESALESSRQDSSLNCHGYGSVVSVTATFGMCAAGWVLDKISSSDSKQ